MATNGIKEEQLPKRFRDIIENEESLFGEGASVTDKNRIPDTCDIPIENPKHWLKIKDVIAVAVDMRGSTKLSASAHQNSTAKSYRLFTSTAVRLFHEFDSPYIDVQGDGVFALFDFDKPHTALAAAVTFKTFCSEVFVPKVKNLTSQDVGVRIGIDIKDVLVRKIGYKRHEGRSDRQNEVWAGKPVNMAYKLASLSDDGYILVSNRFKNKLTDERALKSCGCKNGKETDEKENLWNSRDVKDDSKFDFDIAYELKSVWCERHGRNFCDALIALESD